MLETLRRFGLESDEPPLYQSQRTAAYGQALAQLIAKGLAYRCRCSRSELAAAGACRCHALQLDGEDCAWRLRLAPGEISFEDRIQGHCRYATSLLGDPVLRRRDGLYAYQLAVALDDAFQGITDVVRGADLLESTAWQIAVGQALGLPTARYGHIPLLTEPDGSKLAKSRRSLPLAQLDTAAALAGSLDLLGITLPPELKAAPVSDMLHWSVQHWSPVRIAGTRAIPLPH